ncbi:MAG: endolytic transglycosylase MltG [Acidobacteria bacterium]|nr:endolytic transglycosylase MltG [Acidobacteriota bacterium]
MKLSRREQLLFVLLIGVAAWALGGAFARFDTQYAGYQGGSAIVVIPAGSSPASVASALGDARVIRSPLTFRWLARWHGVSSKLQAGEYLFDRPQTTSQVIDRLVRGDVLLHRVTIPEGLTGAEALARVAEARLASVRDLEAALRDPAAIRDLDPKAADLEGYLFPETYRFARGTPASRIVAEMVGRFKGAFDASMRARAGELGMTVRQAVTLASLIEKETSLPAERGLVSAVFHNRLRAGMLLQCDPTVIYALVSSGRYRGTLTTSDLSFASPYNTYVSPGLPPGPIASPGRASLEAALHPADSRARYFVADGSGGHHFSETLEEHARAVERWRRIVKRGA